MKNNATNAIVGVTRSEESAQPFYREAIHRLLDKAPDGYKLIACLVDDPCELVHHNNPSPDGRTTWGASNICFEGSRARKPEDLLRKWLITRLEEENR